MTSLLKATLSGVLLLVGTLTIPAAAQNRARRLVLLPLDNASGVRTAVAPVQAMLVKAIQKKGWSVAYEQQVAAVLEQHRIRYFDSLEDDARTRLLDANEATAVLTATIYAYSSGRNPIVALAGQLVRTDGKIAWANVSAKAADDTEGLFGAGRAMVVDDLAAEVIESFVRSFPDPGGEARPVRGPSPPMFHERPLAFRASSLDPAQSHRVCILPFDNAAASPDAARTIATIFALRMAAEKGFDIVPAALLRAAALKAGIASFRTIASDDLKRLGEAVGTPLFIRGTVYDFVDPALTPGRAPRVQMEISMIDVTDGHVMWTAHHDRNGEDYTGFLMLGTASNGVTLADRVVAEIIATGTTPANRRATIAVAGRNRQNEVAQNHSKLRRPSEE